MQEKNSPPETLDKISAEDILEKIEQEINQAQAPVFDQILSDHESEFKLKENYNIDDFCQFYDEDFIDKAFWIILGRRADSQGKADYLKELRQGNYSKERILAILRYSQEGIDQNITIYGLRRYHKINNLYKKYGHKEFIFKALRLLEGCLKLPDFIKQLNAYEYHIQTIRDNEYKIGEALKKLERDKFHLKKEFQRNSQFVSQLQNKISTLIDDVNVESKPLSSKKLQQQINSLVDEEKNFHDRMYLAFEDKYRGSREQIKQQMEIYLPYIQAVYTADKPVLDIGCGRGEWLELMIENNIKASGLDLNVTMVSEAQKLNLDVKNTDVLSYLKPLADNSLSAITGIHLIEHLDFNILIKLFQESFRVLKNGGMIIFETPNPENMLVGSHFFYTDPSHKNPLVPVTMEFMSEYLGFSQISIKRLHDYTDEGAKDADGFRQAHIYNAMDYAIIAYKHTD